MSAYPPYARYIPSNVDWLGDIPDHWEVWKITHGFNRIGSGTTPKSDNPIYYDGDIPWVTTSELRETVIVDTSQKVTEEAVASHSALKIYAKGSLAIAMYGATIGRLGVLGVDATFNQACCVFSDPTVFDTRFVYYWLWMRRPILISLSNGGGQPNLSQDDLKKLWIPIPYIEEQQAIARFLDFKTTQIDALIAKKQTLLDKLAEKRTALISHAVTKGLDPQAKMKDSGVAWLGQIPAHWEAKRLKFVVSTFGGGTPNTGKPEYWNGEIPWVSPKDMKCDFIDATEDYLTELGVAESATKIVPVDSVLIVVRSGILRHTIPVARNTVEVSLNQDMKALVTNNHLRPGFIHWLISGLQDGLLPLWSKQGCTVESIEMAYLSNTVIPLPPLDEQDAILEHIGEITVALDKQTTKVAEAVSALTEYRSSLITHAVTGKIDVRGFQIPQETPPEASHG